MIDFKFLIHSSIVNVPRYVEPQQAAENEVITNVQRHVFDGLGPQSPAKNVRRVPRTLSSENRHGDADSDE